MDSHSRSASPREPMRPLHRPPSPPASPGAFDNRAYQHDDADQNHNDSFTSNAPQQNGHNKEPNGDTKLPEAVNLELINLTPKNGTKKKDVEVDMNASNPYDEYFVPVNEHRKFMRGEKLYVTADKRGEKSGCKRPLCWTLLVLIVAAIVALIVLAATGVIFSSSPTTLEQYNTSISSARAFGGIGAHTSSHDHDHNHHDHDHSHHDHDVMSTDQAHTEHGADTQNDAPLPVESDESDISLYVPRTVEGELTIDNEEFTAALEDPESTEYRDFVATFTDGLKRALFDRNTLENGDNDIIVEIVKLRKGSIAVTYRIHWKPKLNADSTPDLLNTESLKSQLDGYLDSNNRMINVYHVFEGNMSTKPVLDICQIDNNQCEHSCEFDETTLEFTCTCPHGQILDMTNQKKCMSILENPYPLVPIGSPEEKELKVSDTDVRPITTKPEPEEGKPVTESVYVSSNEKVFDWKEINHAHPETTTHPDADLNFSHIFGHGNEPNTEIPSVEALPEPKAEPEPAAEPKPEPTAEPKTEPEPAPESKSEPETASESKAEPEAMAEPQAEPEVAPEPKGDPEATAEPQAEPEAAPEPKSEPEATAEPQAEPEAAPEPKAELEATAEPQAEPESTAEPNAESESTAAREAEPKPAAENKSEPEPTADPKAEPGQVTEPNIELMPSAEPNVEPEPSAEHSTDPDKTAKLEFKSGSFAETKFEIETTAEPNAETKLEPNAKVISKPQAIAESTTTMHDENEAESSTGMKSAESGIESSTEHGSTEPEFIGLHVIRIPSKTITTTEPTSVSIETTTDVQPVDYHKIIEQANNHGSSNLFKTMTSKPSLATKDESENQAERDANPAQETERTTLRVSISEPHIMNEPSYEPMPEIISILSEKTDITTPQLTTEDNTVKTTNNEWLLNNSEQDVTKPPEHQNNGMINYHNDSEDRSLKSIDIFAEYTTTEKIEDHISLSGVKSNINTESENNNHDSENTTTLANESNEEHLVPVVVENTGTIADSNIVSKDHNQEIVISEVFKNDTDMVSNTHVNPKNDNEKPQVNNIGMHESRSLDAKDNSKSSDSNTSKEYFISGHFNSTTGVEKHLMEALENNNETFKETSTKKNIDDSMDITFDAINMLYNRSSHFTETKYVINPVTELNVVETTTVSDWLDVPVTEIRLEVMNRLDKHITTESSNTKIDEIISTGVTKDDFEPDYLNNMSSNNKNKEDMPLYGITHDYDSEDLRVKRVNSDRKMTTESIPKETTVTENPLDSVSIEEKNNPTLASLETTTVIEYIYKTAENATHDTSASSTPQNAIEVVSHATTTSTEKNEPAPVWEDSESDKYLAVKELEKPVHIDQEAPTTRLEAIAEIITTSAPPAVTMSMHDAAVASAVPLNVETTSADSTEKMQESKSNVESQTKVNNFNVTIYEISRHNSNSAVTNQHSSEFEDHETEMNPFLPEIENNKSLVKKLQEGHDIEPAIFNETQNENIEDHSNNTSETKHLSSNDDLSAKADENKTAVSVEPANEPFSSFNELMKSNSPTIVNFTSKENKDVSESKPISSFLLDTDDLDKEYTTEHKTAIAENNLENGSITLSPSSQVDSNDDSDFLSVVPIEEERSEEKESLKKDYGSELNDISDSPKKSDRRTLDETKFDSVNDNEA